ncbi:SDR family oxidoreductase [Lacticaseibacillus paracasei]|uniref:Putative oxidoreductase n=1 Tax=Lacticaseibacillus paracasei subsp. paracasei CNCM I-4270 TaxID=1256202 RepID=A0A8E0IF27_LACPA|nr:SDR family oxidoreductase [Lacticaseibacillus paracasei]EPC49969.1 putative oxidoreductase [Lacticaseibacillus paracasei subsp. paracasei CNCM I-4270]MDO5967782.1 SDR family oxidoreductase [Lacticaseibacillus paracasei]
MEITEFNMNFFSLKGKTAIITGGNTGLGRAFSVALAKAGANIFVPSIAPDDGTTEKLVTDAGVKYHFMQADITAEKKPQQVIEEAVETFGSVDILFNSAGISLLDDVLHFDRDKWDPMIRLDLTAAFEMSHEAAKVMIPQKSGKIINICSLFSFLGGQMSPAYAAAKHGIAGLTKAYADELGQHNIQVNGLAPGYFATAITKATRSDPKKNQTVLDHIPANRWGDVADLMGTAVYLSSRAADYVNGTLVVVDGGYLVR